MLVAAHLACLVVAVLAGVAVNRRSAGAARRRARGWDLAGEVLSPGPWRVPDLRADLTATVVALVVFVALSMTVTVVHREAFGGAPEGYSPAQVVVFEQRYAESAGTSGSALPPGLPGLGAAYCDTLGSASNQNGTAAALTDDPAAGQVDLAALAVAAVADGSLCPGGYPRDPGATG